ncbi:amino acid permease [Halobacillus sp. BBL2006]|uniref:amino acid permease n=1 Tax=Halobacillus sp. BBL2006 TaxID=1543706 RepID=UPI000542528B|nr:amino acid permease [Halobacillus sp. BBL2006]KHE68233.1 transporter [Halobacillus sp. BBL2006]
MRKCPKPKSKIEWWQMSFIGVGCIIGTGYFLGAGIAIQKAGTSVLIAYLIAGLGTWIVFECLAKLTARHPEKGSFRTYAKQAYGNWAGFSNGWVYWSSEMLIMGSQLTALAIFAQFWFPRVPLWMLAAVFAVLGLLVILMGVEKVEQMESVFGLMKVAAIVMFILIALAAALGWLGGGDVRQTTLQNLFSSGGFGLWVAFLYAFYAFGGIEVMGLMAQELKDPEDAPKSGKIMLLLLTAIYVLSIYFVLKLVQPNEINADESPFVTALKQYDLPWVPHLFNSVLIIAGFSTMVASLYAVTSMLVTLAEEGDAPKRFAVQGKWRLPTAAFGLTTAVVTVSIIIALLLPGKIFEYLTTAAGLMLLYNWIFILFSYKKLIAKSSVDRIKIMVAFCLILLAVSGTLFDSLSRPGFFVSLGFLVFIALATIIKQRKTSTH